METETIEILLIEDDPAEAGMIREMLAEFRQPGFLVQHVRFLADGLGLLRSRSFDCVIVDLALSDSQGLETALAVRNEAKTTPIVAMTVPDDEEAALSALQSVIQDYLIKGRITDDALKRSIRYAIQRQRDMEVCKRCEQWFASFMLHLPAAAWAKDLHGRYVYANEGDEHIFSMPFSEYSGKRDEEFLPIETARQLRENDERVLAEGESVQTVEFLRQADGIEHHYIVNKFPIPGADGQAAYVAGIALDITERVKAVEALQKSERKFAKIFHGVPALVAISTLEEGRFVDVNDTTTQLLGYRREEIIGSTALELNIWEDLADRAAMLRALEKKGSVKNLEVRLRGKSGQRLVGLFSAEYIELNGDRYLLSLIRDITDRKRAEEELRFSEARFRILHDDNPAMIFTLDAEGRIISTNPACSAHLGYTAEELAGQPVLNIFHKDERPVMAENLQTCMRNPDRVYHWQSCKVCKDGELVWVEELARVVYDMNGALNVVVVCQDITERKRTEEALQEAERKLRNIVENSTNLFFMHTTDHILTYLSPQSRQFFDREPHETLGRRWTKFLTDSPVNQAAIEATQLAIDTGERQPLYQAECIGKTGRKIWVEVNESPIVENGKTIAVVGSLTDITERKRAEEALQKSERKLAKIFHAAPAMLSISTLKEGRFVDVNEAQLQVLGYRREEMIGRTSLELGIWEDVSERAAILQALEEKGSVKNFEVRLRGKSGQRLVGLFSAEYIDLDGDRYMLSLVKDITLKRRAEEQVERLNADLAARATELEEANRELADDLEAMRTLQGLGMLFLHKESLEQILSKVLDAAIAISGADFGNIQIMNPKTFCLQIAVHHGFPQWWLDFWNRVVEGKGVCGTALGRGERVIVEDIEQSPIFVGTEALEIQLKAGVRAVQSTPLVSRSGSLLGMFSTHYKAPHRPTDRELRLLDLLSRHAADFIEQAHLREVLQARAAELEEANQDLEAFNYTVAHDLRKPLTAINGYCELVREICGAKLDEQCTMYLQEAYDGTWRMNRLIDTLLNFSRASRVEPCRERVDLSGMAQEVAAELKLAEPARRATLRIPDGISVIGDANLLRVVLENLLGNAWKYTGIREEAFIEFGATEIGGQPACFVRDNGPGFAMEDADQLFIPFQRLPGSNEFKGHGIGLATVERIIRRHGGRVWAEGEPGKGATFYFTLDSAMTARQ